MKLWRDYVIATLAVDAGIVFCFAPESKFESREQASEHCARCAVLLELGIGHCGADTPEARHCWRTAKPDETNSTPRGSAGSAFRVVI